MANLMPMFSKYIDDEQKSNGNKALHESLASGGVFYVCENGDTLTGIIFVNENGKRSAQIRLSGEPELLPFLEHVCKDLLKRVGKICVFEPANSSDLELIEVAGFEQSGRLKAETLLDGVLTDILIYEQLSPEFKQQAIGGGEEIDLDFDSEAPPVRHAKREVIREERDIWDDTPDEFDKVNEDGVVVVPPMPAMRRR